ncbi:uncharacterized protein BP5553_05449 [Venustampulla echinocandica]|uniref:Integral membrane protein n=1 Tax=Venustampulla echinocandica TaxID=2656787 RepID=A0A370TR58_9HELO|nr:uncharacterized protein BP5553_05449 [Venustampulla echinocandica]RDL38016.1 hypothetical protein BP5553_05449 [Venustampulla echinocandica]
MTGPHLLRLRHNPDIKAIGPVKPLNPTFIEHPFVYLSRKVSSEEHLGEDGDSGPKAGKPEVHEVHAKGFHRYFSTRDKRKARHAVIVNPAVTDKTKYIAPPPTNTFRATMQGIWRMCTKYPYWNVSYLVAVVFTLGSVVWCINAFFGWLPLVRPSTEFPGETNYGTGITAFIGATIFEFGSFLLMIEAVNEDEADCFGWALEEVIDESGLFRVRAHDCSRRDEEMTRFPKKQFPSKDDPVKGMEGSEKRPTRKWVWLPTWHELRTHYFREIGFLASLSQTIGATIFWIAGFTALPPLSKHFSTAAENGAFWLPQVIGGVGFIISGALFTIETQKKWYIPAPRVLGWHVGFWNFIGGIGFTLCGALGFATQHSGVEYQSSLATFWGSWAFLIGSVIQWYECLDTHPVKEEKVKES